MALRECQYRAEQHHKKEQRSHFAHEDFSTVQAANIDAAVRRGIKLLLAKAVPNEWRVIERRVHYADFHGNLALVCASEPTEGQRPAR
jgi:hypothetical protein